MIESLKKFVLAVRRVLDSYVFYAVEFLAATLAIVFGKEIEFALGFVFLLCLKLLVCDDILAILNPILMAAVFVTNCYDSYDTFIKFVWAIIPAAVCLVFNIVFYRKKLRVGSSLYGIIAVAAAILVGGIGKFSAGTYVNGMNAYYYFGLSLGMIAFYFFMKSRLSGRDTEKLAERFAVVMTFLGLISVVNILWYYSEFFMQTEIESVVSYLSTNYISRNNLSTYLMLAMPFPLYLSKKYPAMGALTALFYVAMLCTGSRGGIIMGTVEFVACLVYWIVDGKKYIVKALTALGVLALCALAFAPLVIELIEWRSGGNAIFGENEARFKMLTTLLDRIKGEWSWREFLLGEGLLSDANKPYYQPKQGAMYWYHMMIPQIVGSFGLVGVLAYGYQFLGRVKLIFTKRTRWAMCLGVSYLGILLMSQVNPGEFCPLPFEALSVTLFILLEEKIVNT